MEDSGGPEWEVWIELVGETWGAPGANWGGTWKLGGMFCSPVDVRVGEMETVAGTGVTLDG